MGTRLGGFSKSFPMNTNMTGFRWFSKNLCILVLWMKVASALESLKQVLSIMTFSAISRLYHDWPALNVEFKKKSTKTPIHKRFCLKYLSQSLILSQRSLFLIFSYISILSSCSGTSGRSCTGNRGWGRRWVLYQFHLIIQ